MLKLGLGLLGEEELSLLLGSTEVINLSEQATEREGMVCQAPSSDSTPLASKSNPASESGDGGETGLLMFTVVSYGLIRAFLASFFGLCGFNFLHSFSNCAVWSCVCFAE